MRRWHVIVLALAGCLFLPALAIYSASCRDGYGYGYGSGTGK